MSATKSAEQQERSRIEVGSMPTIVAESPNRVESLDVPRKVWTRAECAAFEATGLWDQQKLELIEGELIDKMSKKRPHTNTHTLFLGWLSQAFGSDRVNVETPIDVAPEDNPTSEPGPDVIVLNRPTWEIDRNNPQPGDLLLVVEVADSSLRFDLATKAGLYARAGIADYWVFDVTGRRLIVHRDPVGGRYRSVEAYGENESAAPLAAPGSELKIASVFRRSG